MEAVVGSRSNETRSRTAARLALVIVLLLSVAAAVVVLLPPEAVVTDIALDSPSPLHIGQTATCRVSVQTPWFASPDIAPTELPDALQNPHRPPPSFAGLTWRGWRWDVRIPLQPLATGSLHPGTVTVVVRGLLPNSADRLAVQLPELTVVPRPDADVDEVSVAGPLPDPASEAPQWRRWRRFALLTAAVLLTAALVIGLVRRRGKRLAELAWTPPAHVRAQVALQELEQSLPMAPEPFYVALTDILRAYVEKRFRIRAAEQTTPEFLRSISQDATIQTAHRDALSECMRVADVIKFARGQATQDDLQDSLDQARRFVAETVPRDDEDGDGLEAPSPEAAVSP